MEKISIEEVAQASFSPQFQNQLLTQRYDPNLTTEQLAEMADPITIKYTNLQTREDLERIGLTDYIKCCGNYDEPLNRTGLGNLAYVLTHCTVLTNDEKTKLTDILQYCRIIYEENEFTPAQRLKQLLIKNKKSGNRNK